MRDKLSKLIDVKTLVTFAVIGVFSYLAIIGRIDTKDVMIVVTAIITYFFSKPKKEGGDNEGIS